MRYVTVVLVVMFLYCAGVPAAFADVFGLGPTLGGNEPIVAGQRGASGPLPSQIVGLQGYMLWGKNSGSAAAVTYKHRFASTPVVDRTIRWRYGFIGGLASADNVTKPMYGGFIEAEIEGLAGVVLVIRADDGFYVNPGAMINFLSVSF